MATSTAKDQLFILPPFFPDPSAGESAFHCAECAQVEGLLSYYPFLRTRLEVTYVSFPRPRAPLVELLGAKHQGCPVLVVAGKGKVPGGTKAPTGRRFVAGAAAISAYLAAVHGIPVAHP